MKNRGGASKGLSLMELLLAAAIFAFVMSGILYMFVSTAFLDSANRNKSIAATHAESVMEDIMEYMKSGDLSPLQTAITSGTWNWNSVTICAKMGCVSPCAYPCVLNSESITTTWVNDSINPLHVVVTVSWKDREQANTRTLVLETLISKR